MQKGTDGLDFSLKNVVRLYGLHLHQTRDPDHLQMWSGQSDCVVIAVHLCAFLILIRNPNKDCILLPLFLSPMKQDQVESQDL